MRHHGTVPAKWLVSGLALVLAGGCVTRTEPTQDLRGNVGPSLVVERFLQAANAVAASTRAQVTNAGQARADLETMGQLFGTKDGSLLKTQSRQEVETRMVALASVLRHEDFAIEGERLVPGRTGEAVQVVVRLKLPTREATVPFTVVRSGESWLVEQIGIEAITGRS